MIERRTHCVHYRNGGEGPVFTLELFCCLCSTLMVVEGMSVLDLWSSDEARERVVAQMRHHELCHFPSSECRYP